MKNIFLVNLDVSSGIEYTGNSFEKWLQELSGVYDYELFTYKTQTASYLTAEVLHKKKPDVIIINAGFPRIVEPVLYYRIFRPEVKIIFINHSWRDIYRKDYSRDSLTWQYFLEKSNHIISLNYKPPDKEWPDELSRKIENRYYPCDPDIFKVKTQWSDREKLFVHIGTICPLKLSLDFIRNIRSTNLKVDCFGPLVSVEKQYLEDINSTNQLDYNGVVSQDKIGDILNEYKYFILPHDGYEIFNITLQQAISCGTIPLVCNDMSGNFDSSWIDWAEGLYYNCDNSEELINNMMKIESDSNIRGNYSNYISDEAKKRWDYQEFKDYFGRLVRDTIYKN